METSVDIPSGLELYTPPWLSIHPKIVGHQHQQHCTLLIYLAHIKWNVFLWMCLDNVYTHICNYVKEYRMPLGASLRVISLTDVITFQWHWRNHIPMALTGSGKV